MDLKFWNIAISTLSDVSDCVPLILFFYIGKKKEYLLLFTYFCVSFAIKATTILLIFVWKVHNTLPFYHILAPLEFMLLFLFLNKLNNLTTGVKIGIVLVVLIFDIANTLLMQPPKQFNSIAWGINTLILLMMSLRYLYNLYSNIENIQIEKHPGFIINAGLLIYFAGSLFTYLLGWYILSETSNDFFANSWMILAPANILKNIIVTFGLWIARTS